MEIKVRGSNIERAIADLARWYQKNLKAELRIRRGFETKREKMRRKQIAARRRCKRRAIREAQSNQGR